VSLARPALKARKGSRGHLAPLERLARPVWLEPTEAPVRLVRLVRKAPKAQRVWPGPLARQARQDLLA